VCAIVRKIYQHLIDNNILHSEQHGIVHGLSSTCRRLHLSNVYLFFVKVIGPAALEEGVAMQVDFSKAFDVVQHDKLFTKLRAYGVDELLLQ